MGEQKRNTLMKASTWGRGRRGAPPRIGRGTRTERRKRGWNIDSKGGKDCQHRLPKKVGKGDFGKRAV